jgi:hypothetical protein
MYDVAGSYSSSSEQAFNTRITPEVESLAAV